MFALDLSRTHVVRDAMDIRALAQSPEGFLWIGHGAGLLRFDGREAESMLGNEGPEMIDNVVVSRAGDVWAAGLWDGRIYRLIGGRGRPEVYDARSGLRAGRIHALVEGASGTMWIGADTGLWRWSGGQFERHALEGHGRIVDLHLDARQRLWISVEDGVGIWKDSTLDMLWRAKPGASVGVMIDRNGHLVLGTYGDGLHVLRDSGSGWKGEAIAGLGHQSVQSMTVGPDGRIWLGLYKGIDILDLGDEAARVSDFPIETTSPDDAIYAIAFDRDGNLLAGTRAHGLVTVPNQRPIQAVMPDRFGRVSSTWVDPDGSVLLLGDGGRISRWRDGTLTTVLGRADVDLQSMVRSPARDGSGPLWLGSATAGLYRLQEGALRPHALPGWQQGTPTTALTADRQGAVWVGGGGQVWRLSADGVTQRHDLAALAVESHVMAGVEDESGTLWLVSERHGLLRRREGGFERIGLEAGLPTLSMGTVTARPGPVLWLPTKRGGIVRYRDGVFTHLPGGRGIPQLTEYIAPDGAGHLWVVGPRSVERFLETDLMRIADGDLAAVEGQPFTMTDGLPANGGFWGSPSPWALDGQQRLLLTLFRGAALIPRPERPLKVPAPAPLILQMSLDGVALEPVSAGRGRAVGRGNLQVEYAAPLFVNADRLRYRHRLHGFDREWQENSSARLARYANLPPGTFTFEVASYFAGDPGRATYSARIALVLLPPFHATWWFKSLGVTVVLLLVLLAHRTRMAWQRARFAEISRERDRIAGEIHDSLQQTLLAARMQMDSAFRKRAEAHESDAHIERARDLMKQAVDETRAAIWSLKSGLFGTTDLASALTLSLGQALRGTTVDFRLTRNGTVRRLPPEREVQVGRLVREGVTNALKHARPTQISVHLDFAGPELRVAVKNDGEVFSTRGADGGGTGCGLEAMRERVMNLGGHLDIHSDPQGGTTMTFTIPFSSGDER